MERTRAGGDREARTAELEAGAVERDAVECTFRRTALWCRGEARDVVDLHSQDERKRGGRSEGSSHPFIVPGGDVHVHFEAGERRKLGEEGVGGSSERRPDALDSHRGAHDLEQPFEASCVEDLAVARVGEAARGGDQIQCI